MNLMRRLFSSYKPKLKTAERWNREYAGGKWESLRSLDEIGRYMAIVGIIQNQFKQPRILDLGCGFGLLAALLKPYGYQKYVGVDISDSAIEAAQTQDLDDTIFVAEDLDQFESIDEFDVIIFNEVLYYLADPIRILNRLRTNLSSDGLMIVSMVDWNRHGLLWKQINPHFDFIYSTRAQTGQKPPWDVKILKPIEPIGISSDNPLSH